MSRSDTTLDVRDMLCAQALAVIARAIDPVLPGTTLAIQYNAEDVRRDLAAWAKERGHRLVEAGHQRLQLTRGTA